MPSFSFRKHPKFASSRQDDGSSADVDHVDNEKVQRRLSKRDFFRGLLKRSNTPVEEQDVRRHSAQVKVADLQISPAISPSSPTTPMSNPNKPLPPPPAPGTVEPEPTKAPLKLERIMSPLKTSELHRLFSGAPQFFVRSEEQHDGAPYPLVDYPWDEEPAIRDLRDHIQIQDSAWSSVTAPSRTTRRTSKDTVTPEELHGMNRSHYVPRCRERPNIPSTNGLERGTVGYTASLETAVADALKESPEDLAEGEAHTLVQRRRQFIQSKDGLRPFSEATLIDRLVDVSVAYQSDLICSDRSTVELYTELFTQLLYPPSRVTDAGNPYSLQVQIEFLLRVLGAPGVWIDFSLVEWRIRLGQILWGPPPEPDPEDGLEINGEDVEPGAQKFWLLLQILLSCELLVRLDSESQNGEHGQESVKPAALDRLDNSATERVNWSLLLARSWLENIKIERTKPETVVEKKVSSGWLATLTGTSQAETEPHAVENMETFQFRGRNQERQLSGLVHFARKLEWPNLEVLLAKVSANGIGITDSAQGTPAIGTPMSVGTQRSSSYFPSRRPTIRRGLSRPQKISGLIQPTGWLSNSYLSGLVLPGEGMSHFLISTLLENDDDAVTRLGENANLYGGFIYLDRSYWSTSCIVGRVLAGDKRSTECMGWISSNIQPRGAGEGWVNIDVETDEQADITGDTVKNARIWQKGKIERDGNVIGDSDESSTLPGDFLIPYDKNSQESLSIALESLDFFAAADSGHTTPILERPTPLSGVSEAPEISTYSAMMRFSLASDSERREINVALTHDVQFVTAHPCVPSKYMDVLESPTSPVFPVPAPSSTLDRGHPLHKSFTFTQIALSDLLLAPSQSISALISRTSSDEEPTRSSSSASNVPKALIIDCTSSSSGEVSTLLKNLDLKLGQHQSHRFGSDMEMLVRALCAERGWDALISRQGRGCVACAVREFSALGWAGDGVIIRL
ncbi:hypothetical protein PVAG01_09037 [Phlyctema vagabunda]|uniref:Uncharacterized protein n=1 Tax=Phlyctema vagabunda TaxID=108571 RepID=A0ABR4P683_9HELO